MGLRREAGSGLGAPSCGWPRLMTAAALMDSGHPTLRLTARGLIQPIQQVPRPISVDRQFLGRGFVHDVCGHAVYYHMHGDAGCCVGARQDSL